MIIRISHYRNTFACLILLFSGTVSAGILYRFANEQGIQTLSRSLPPSAAQKGYDILDDKTMHLIKRIEPALTQQQLVEHQHQAKQQAEQQRQAEEIRQQQQAKREKQFAYDRNLLASYQSEQDLINTRNRDIDYQQQRIKQTKTELTKFKKQLVSLQQQAAEQELSGKGISKNLSLRMQAAQTEINNANNKIIMLNEELHQLSQQYNADLQRLKILLKNKH